MAHAEVAKKPIIQLLGAHRIELVLTSGINLGNSQFIFTIAPDHDFLITGYRYEALGRPPESACSDEFHVEKQMNCDGLWMPSEATYVSSFMGVINTYKCVLKQATLTPPNDNQMRVEFPPGTEVMDSIAMQNYVILKDGKREYRSFYDVNTGRIIAPATPSSNP